MITIFWDPEFFYQWPAFLILVIIYSALVCSGEFRKEGSRIFAHTNARSIPAIVGIHAVFVAILFMVWRLASVIDPHLPHSLTDHIGRGGSFFNILFTLGMILLQFVERRWLIAQRGDPRSFKAM